MNQTLPNSDLIQPGSSRATVLFHGLIGACPGGGGALDLHQISASFHGSLDFSNTFSTRPAEDLLFYGSVLFSSSFRDSAWHFVIFTARYL
uniref:Uncharacterized protein n=1 Tax=Rhizophora mucronata TaxID=61149 RepID=A0A2P2LKV2_RHIMU